MSTNSIDYSKLAETSINLTDIIAKATPEGIMSRTDTHKLQTFLNTIGVSGYKGMVTPNVGGVPQLNGSDITEDGVYIVSQNGDYGDITGINLDNLLILLDVKNLDTTPIYVKAEIPLNITLNSLDSFTDDLPTPDSDNFVKSGGVVDYVNSYLNKIVFQSGYINTSQGVGNVVDLTVIPITGGLPNYEYAVKSLSEGQKVYLKGYGGSSPRLYCFIDVNDVILEVATANLDESDGITITAPLNTDRVVFNINTDVSDGFAEFQTNIEGQIIADFEEYKNTTIPSLLNEKVSIEKVTLTQGYINTSQGVGNVADLTVIPITGGLPNYHYILQNAVENESFVIKGAGGGSPRLYAFLDSSNTILEVADASLDVYTEPIVVLAPKNTAKIVINVNLTTYADSYISPFSISEKALSQRIVDLSADVFPDNSFLKVSPNVNKLTGFFDENITEFNDIQGTTGAVTNEVQGGILICEATQDYSNTISRFWIGQQFNPDLYATEDKDIVILIKGRVTATNAQEAVINPNGTIIAQDLQDGVEASFDRLIEINYTAGQDNSTKYSFVFVRRRDENINNVSVRFEFDHYVAFEKIEGYSIDDYKAAINELAIIPKKAPIGTATETYVNTQISESLASVRTKTANDLIANYDIIMLLIGGQSVALGGGASLQGEDFKNTLSFVGGSSTFGATSVNTTANPELSAFANQAEKDAFYGTDFVLLENNHANEGYPPITTTVIGLMDLINKENGVDVEDYGVQFFPYAWGRSGSYISTMIQGTAAYNDMTEAVQKVKDFADKNGKTMAVLGMHWVKGEAEGNDPISTTKLNYRTLFDNMNTDLKAITGQTEDLHFFLNQPSPWIGIDTGGAGGVKTDILPQNAIVELVRENTDCHFAGAMYQFPYADVLHPADRAVVGLTAIMPMKKVLLDAGNWQDFVPQSHTVINNGAGKWFVQLKFDVPVKPARFNISANTYENANGKQVNFGFKIYNNSDVDVLTAEPYIVRGDTIVLETNVDPTGFRISYAENGQLGGGNLCDSQNYTLRNKGIDYPVINFAAGFNDYVI